MTNQSQAGYGALKGVFLPTLLSVFGVVMFLRLGWMVGQLGVGGSLVVIVLSCTVAGLTALSIAATVTNMRMGGGGAYFLISRSLGIEIGTAIGLLLYLAQSLGIAFYLAGFSESILIIFPDVKISTIYIEMAILALLGLVTFRSSDLMVKLQIPIALVIGFGLLSFFSGQTMLHSVPEITPRADQSFWSVLSIFFPAVTGIISGIGLSGQLKDPGKSLPRGMFAALGVATLIFLAIPLVLSHRASGEMLRSNTLIMGELATYKPALILALWAAALSSAISSFLAAPRALQALAHDRVLPPWLGRGFTKDDDEPRLAMILTTAIALAGITLGDLNAIAPVLSMVYLTAFVVLNFSAGIQSLINAPSWRPRLRVPASLSLIGAAMALIIMIMIDSCSGLLSILAASVIYYLMLRRNMETLWGDARRGTIMLLARYAILRLQEFPLAPHSWKPHFLVMAGSPSRRFPIISFVDSLSQDAGFITVAVSVPKETSAARSQDMANAVRSFLLDRKIPALVRVIPGSSWQESCRHMLGYYGLGNVVPDTIIAGIPTSQDSTRSVAEVLEMVASYKRNLILLRLDSLNDTKRKQEIAVWWGGKRDNASLMIALGYLLQMSEGWDRAQLWLRSVIGHENQRKEVEKRLEDFITRARIDARYKVHELPENFETLDLIVKESRDAGIVFIGLRARDEGEDGDSYVAYVNRMVEKTRALANIALVMAGDDVHLAQLFR